MKKRFLIPTLILSMAMMLASVSSVFATIDPADAYDYTIKVYAGEHGHFTKGDVSDSGKTLTIKCDPGDTVIINQSTTGFELDDDMYYARGFRKAGHDNDELVAAFPSVDEDAAYEVAYGIAGGMVKYTVMYLDANGDPVHDEEVFYGMAGDKPVVSYRYVEGYQPNAYNITKTLSENEAENVFAFSYLENESSEATQQTETVIVNRPGAANAANNGQNANAGTNAGAGANAGAAGAGNEGNGPATIVDLDEGATPLAENAEGGDAADLAENETPKAGVNPALIGAGAAVLAAIAAAVIVIAKRRSDAELVEEDDDDE